MDNEEFEDALDQMTTSIDDIWAEFDSQLYSSAVRALKSNLREFFIKLRDNR